MKARTIFNLVRLNRMAVYMDRNISFVYRNLEIGQENTFDILNNERKICEESIDI